jgi:sec-independent protein translocase protein TatC
MSMAALGGLGVGGVGGVGVVEVGRKRTIPTTTGGASARWVAHPRAESSYSSTSSTPRSVVTRASSTPEQDTEPASSSSSTSTDLQKFLSPNPAELPGDFEMPIWDHLEELRERVMAGAIAGASAVAICFLYSKDLVLFLEAPVAEQGVRFLQLSPGEFFFTTLQVGGYSGILLAAPTILYEIAAYVVPGLTKSERQFLAPIIFGSSLLFYVGVAFGYEVLSPAALKFFVSYSDGAVESLWSIQEYFKFVLTLMLSTGLSFQLPVIQILVGQLGLVSSSQMFAQWRFVVVGATVAAAVLTPSTDPFTQTLLALPLIGLYLGGAGVVRLIEGRRDSDGGDLTMS